MLARIGQRTKADCSICVTAMVTGLSYEQVVADSARYETVSPEGKFYAWWEPYLRDLGFRFAYRPFMDLYKLQAFRGSTVGILGLSFPHLKAGHVVAVDEIGVIDPADGGLEHMTIQEHILSRRRDGAEFHEEFLAVELRPPRPLPLAPSHRRTARVSRAGTSTT